MIKKRRKNDNKSLICIIFLSSPYKKVIEVNKIFCLFNSSLGNKKNKHAPLIIAYIVLEHI